MKKSGSVLKTEVLKLKQVAEKCTQCGESMKRMGRFWVCVHCKKTVPAEFLE